MTEKGCDNHAQSEEGPLAYPQTAAVSPVVPIPEQHSYAVDDVGLAELHRDASGLVTRDGVCCVPLLPVIVLCVPIQEDVANLPLDRDGIKLRRGHILLWNCTHKEDSLAKQWTEHILLYQSSMSKRMCAHKHVCMYCASVCMYVCACVCVCIHLTE